jgi:hypothetical protein
MTASPARKPYPPRSRPKRASFPISGLWEHPKCLLSVATTAFAPINKRRMKSLGRKSKSKLQVYTEVPLQLIPEIAAVDAKSGNFSGASLEKRKEEAEKPLYLRRL